MQEAYQESTQLIGEIYDAALDPSRWASVLAKITKYVGGQAAGILLKDAVRKPGVIHYEVGLDPCFVQLYLGTYWKLGPVARLLDYEVGRIVTIPELVPYEEFRAGRFYREWAEPQGWIDAANAVLEKTPKTFAYLSVIRSKASGMVDDEMRQRMGLVVPHVGRAVQTEKVIRLKQAEVATFADILDGLSPAIFLVDVVGQIIHANAASRSLLRKGNFLRSINGRLTATDAQVDRTLHDAFVAAGGVETGGKSSALPLPDETGRNSYVAHVLPLTVGERHKAGAASAAVAALFVSKIKFETVLPSEIIGKTYNLTPSELRVLLAIVNVGGVRQVAGDLGVADTTVKTHLGRLFEKTGVSRQADLVKLVAGYSCMLVD
ncbi:MAG TPA: helix-turn-helix transcriptional regulator [Pseudolabrys sp.]|nr:helix-turn-helix transcriptional regulator [Pseudolabrys sp.]